MTSTINLICFNCVHWHELESGCKAFSEIPDSILRSNKHSKPLKNQKNNLVYKPLDKS